MARRLNDFYPTPAWATQALLQRFHLPAGSQVFEPCAGALDMATVLRDHHYVTTNDPDLTRATMYHRDARDGKFWDQFGRWDAIVTNPPFVIASDILRQALDHSDHVAFLLRLTFLEPCEGRERLLVETPPRRLIVLPRISFTGDGGTDSVTCAWFVWSSRVDPGIEIVGDPNPTPLLP